MKLDITTHKTILFQILKDIYSDTTISPFLGFKGGSAALMFHRLDSFDLPPNQWTQMKGERGIVKGNGGRS